MIRLFTSRHIPFSYGTPRSLIRELDPLYPVLFIDGIVVKVRNRRVHNTPYYVVMAVTAAGERDILTIWAATEVRWLSSGCRSSPS
uniref:transposase n=1 Tax=Arthrobacter agilis TaxID=37921 RepID=UPI0027D859F1|nr:transposase [Arthrobacter agilis]